MELTERADEKSYRLLDSGGGEKLEQFGPLRLVRPASVCLWKKRLPPKYWENADARYHPDAGWLKKPALPDNWLMELPNGFERTEGGALKLELRLQTNGQVGLFPEHASYFNELVQALSAIRQRTSREPKVLNLFAYTGMATVLCARQGAEVCHVDLSKKVLGWARRNLELNAVPESTVRFICDDALKFLKREVKRRNLYDVVIVDPPSFSRISKSQYWKLFEILPELVGDVMQVIQKESGAALFTCHDPAISAEMLANLMLDFLPSARYTVTRHELGLNESEGKRILPSGSFALCQSGA